MIGPQWLHDAISMHGYWVVLLAVGIESMGVPFPGETALVLAAVYAGTGGGLNIGFVVAAAAAGAILGDNAGYSLGRYGGYPLARRALRLLHLRESALETTQQFFARHGDKTVFFGRFFAILRTWAAFLAGINRMPRGVFFIWNAAGGIAWATLYGLLGFVLGRNIPLLERVLRGLGIAGVVALVLVVVAGVGYLVLRRRRAARRESVAATEVHALDESVAPTPERLTE